MTLAEKIQLGYYACVALGLIFGIAIMAIVKIDRRDMESEDNKDEEILFDIWEAE